MTIHSPAQASDEPMRAAPVDGDAIAKSKRIMAMIDDYTEALDSPINQHARDARTAIRCALMAEFEAATPRATADVDLCEAVGKLIKAKGRFHTEQNYAAVVNAYDAATKGAKT